MVGISKTFGKELSPEKMAQIWALYVYGLTYRSISAQTRVDTSTIGNTIKNVSRNLANGLENPFVSQPRSGRPPKLDDRAVRRLLRSANGERFDTPSALATPSKSGQQIRHATVRKILKENNKARRRARKKPWISPENKIKRLAFRRRNKHTPWTLICWSDEAYFEIGEDGRTCYVTRSPNEEYHPDCLQPTFKSGRTKVGVWGCFMGPHKGPLVILPQGTRLNHREYLDQIFLPHFLPFYNKMKEMYGHGVQLQEDGASYHHVKMLKQLKRAWDIRVLDWPAQSPDLSPIENLWHWMKLRIGTRRHRIKNVTQMAAALYEVWEEITPEVLVKLVNTMPKRLDLLRESKGGPIKY